MERKQIEGQWWLPENRDSKVPGTLVIEEDRIELSLLGALRDHRASAVAQENPDGSTAFTFTEESMEQDGVYPRILGEAGGKAYTLEDCFQTRRTNLFGGGLQTQRVNVHSVFEGLHFDPEEPVEFSEIVVKLDGLVMFVQRSGLSETIETKGCRRPSPVSGSHRHSGTSRHGGVRRHQRLNLPAGARPHHRRCRLP